MSQILPFQQKQKNCSKEKEKETIFSKERKEWIVWWRWTSRDSSLEESVNSSQSYSWQATLSLSLPFPALHSEGFIRNIFQWIWSELVTLEKRRGQKEERDMSLTVAFLLLLLLLLLLLSMTTVTHPFPLFLSERVSIARTSWSFCHEQCSIRQNHCRRELQYHSGNCGDDGGYGN